MEGSTLISTLIIVSGCVSLRFITSTVLEGGGIVDLLIVDVGVITCGASFEMIVAALYFRSG